jgi:bilirubin oxidase
MNRRSFLLAGAACVSFSARATAAMKMEDMPGMGAVHGKAARTGVVPTLPEGAPLRDPPRLANRATQPGLFEAALTAAPAKTRFINGVETTILAYNGQSPGPLIEAVEGERIAISFANRIPGEESTIHWHGMPTPADQDGGPMDAVASGADRTYAFDLPEGSAGSYWYHPHPHGKTAAQV